MITIPTSAIAQPDDTGKTVAPEVGDMVDLGAAQAEVTGVDGENCSLCIKSINGKEAKDSDGGADDSADVPDDSPDPSDASDIPSASGNDKERVNLMRKAAKSDAKRGW